MKIQHFFFFIICIVFVQCKAKYDLEKDKDLLIPQLEGMVARDQKYRVLLDELHNKGLSKTDYEKKYDSLWNMQQKIDMENTSKLIAITKKYGFPNPDRLDVSVPVWIIFQHTPKVHIKAVKKIIQKELQAGRLYPAEYEMISWHLNGRKGMPFGLENGMEIQGSKPDH